MAKDKITEYDATANNNTVCGDVNIAENSALPSDMNNFAREIMSHLKEGLGSGTPLYVDQTNNRLGIGTSSPSFKVDIQGTDSQSIFIKRTDASVVGGLQLQDFSTGGLIRTVGAKHLRFDTDSTERMRIDANGHVTKPMQPCFSATATTTDIPLATITTVTLSSERFDVGSNLASNTFTAPISGKYLFTYMLYFTQVDADHTSLDVHIKTSNKQYQQTFSPNTFLNSDSNFSVSGSVLADMDADDTCIFTTRVAGGSAQTDIHPDSQVSGVLIC
jgi:hypothetical protein